MMADVSMNGGAILMGLSMVGPACVVLVVLSFARLRRARPRRRY